MVFSIPWANTVVFGSTATITRLLGVLTFGVGAITVLASGKLRPLKGIHIMMAVFVWWAALTFYWSLAPDLTWEWCWSYARLLGMVWVIWQFTPTLYRTRCLMQALVLGAFVTIVGTFTSRMLADQALGVRFTASGFDPNIEALILALCIPVAWHLSTVGRGPGVWLNRSYIPLAMIAILLTASRAGFAAALVALLIIPWTLGTLSRRARIVTMLAVAAIIFATYSLIPSSSWERVAAAPDAVAAGNLSQRMEIWEAGLTVVSEHAIVGVGTGAFLLAVEPVFGRAAAAHNAYLSVLAETGVIGFVLFCSVFVWLLVLVFRMPSAERRLWLTVVAVWLVGAFFLTWERSHMTWLLWGLLVARAYAVDSPVGQTVGCQPERTRKSVRGRPSTNGVGVASYGRSAAV